MSLVRNFHRAFDISPPSALTVDDVLKLRDKLIAEETLEVHGAVEELRNARSPEELLEAKAHLLKELADLLYVTFGFAELFNLPLDEAFVEVHLNNMSKLGPSGKPIRREDGKVLKPEGFKECDLRPLIQGRL